MFREELQHLDSGEVDVVVATARYEIGLDTFGVSFTHLASLLSKDLFEQHSRWRADARSGFNVPGGSGPGEWTGTD
jgi:hypothetical protein